MKKIGDGFESAYDLEYKDNPKSENLEEGRGGNKKEFVLNEDQLEAINTLEGNLLILASAGTGKTTTIVERYLNLVKNHGYRPNEILMTTFTNKAAKDMTEKIAKKTNRIPGWAGTMHSLFLRILRENKHFISPKGNFTLITDDYEKKKIVRQILEKNNINTREDFISYFMNRIARFKNTGVLPEELDDASISEDEEPEKGIVEEIIDDEVILIDAKMKKYGVKIYKEYQKYLHENNVMDFDEILLKTYEIFQKFPEILEKYRKKFRIIMVDEAQDLNVVQIRILNLLENNNLCLIGDDCQNIYEWRGSSNELVFKFDKTHKKVILKENHRSTATIIEGINKAIKALDFKIDKQLICTREKGSRIRIEGFEDFSSEINYIVYQVKNLIEEGVKKEDIAVLFRTNNIGKQVEKAFRRNRIPCHLSRARGFFEREEVKDILSFLKLKVNPYSMPDFERIGKLMSGFGKVKLEKVREIARIKNCSYIEALAFSDEITKEVKLRQELERFMLALKEEEHPLKSFLIGLGYMEKLNKKYEDEEDKLDDKHENIKLIEDLFKGHALGVEGIQEFLDGLIELDKKEKTKDKVILSTIHSAKGLEWKHVFLAACNERLLPFYKDALTKIKKDSELRLFYVAISRAKDFLIITHSARNDWKELDPSRFLDIIY
ncbi:MAG: ATP-dependent helicase [Nanoarchaeota archaeon]|nr:ATP-dependent helicase [Nanoarchaeota archaeon]